MKEVPEMTPRFPASAGGWRVMSLRTGFLHKDWVYFGEGSKIHDI